MVNQEQASAAKAIAQTLLEQRDRHVERGFYWENQIAFVYNSEKMEGNPLSEEETRAIFETRTVIPRTRPSSFDHYLETVNHFKLFDRMLETYAEPLTKDLLQEYHRILKQGTADDVVYSDIVVGDWKTQPNEVGNMRTVDPKYVDDEIGRLIAAYESKDEKDYRDIAGMHVFFERIHPFQDGNGRVGRIVMFKECLRHSLEPFIVLDEHKRGYYAGISAFVEDESILLGFIDEMHALYMHEYSALVPEWHLLPRFEDYREHHDEHEHSEAYTRFFKERPDNDIPQ